MGARACEPPDTWAMSRHRYSFLAGKSSPSLLFFGGEGYGCAHYFDGTRDIEFGLACVCVCMFTKGQRANEPEVCRRLHDAEPRLTRTLLSPLPVICEDTSCNVGIHAHVRTWTSLLLLLLFPAFVFSSEELDRVRTIIFFFRLWSSPPLPRVRVMPGCVLPTTHLPTPHERGRIHTHTRTQRTPLFLRLRR